MNETLNRTKSGNIAAEKDSSYELIDREHDKLLNLPSLNSQFLNSQKL